MARFTTDDYKNMAAVVIGLALAGNSAYQAHQQQIKVRQCREAKRYAAEASARLRNMVNHMYKNRASKDVHIEALNAAKNVISYEIRDELGLDNPYLRATIKSLHDEIDNRIAKLN